MLDFLSHQLLQISDVIYFSVFCPPADDIIYVHITGPCSMFPKSTHETFAQKLYQTFTKNKRFIKPKLSRTSFTISHYAGEVMTSSSFWKYLYFHLSNVMLKRPR